MAIKKIKVKDGISIIELLVAIALCAIALTCLLGLIAFSFQTNYSVKNNTLARDLMQEAAEIAKNIRDGSAWDTDGIGTITNGLDYHPEKSGSPPKWILVQGNETVGIFTRKIVFEAVLRDAGDNIVLIGGANDPDTRRVTVIVSWNERGRNREEKIITYLTNWRQ